MPAVTSDHRVWYNPKQDESWFMSISEVLTLTTVFSVMLPAAAMVREKERGTVEQLLVSPLSPFQIMLPKVLAMTAVILVGTAATLFGILHEAFHVPMRGSLILYFALTTFYVFTTAGLGLFLATFAANQAQVGLMKHPADRADHRVVRYLDPARGHAGVGAVSDAFSPLRYFVEASYGILLRGAGLDSLWDSVLGMVILGSASFGFGVWRFRRQFD